MDPLLIILIAQMNVLLEVVLNMHLEGQVVVVIVLVLKELLLTLVILQDNGLQE